MNLVKNGAVLLAAFTVFAATSCNNSNKKELSIEKGLEWVEEHFKEVQKRTVKTSTTKWDYSKNKSNGKKIETWPAPYKGLDINGFTALGVEMMFDVKKEDAKKSTGEVTIEGSGVLGDGDVNESWVKADFERYFSGDDVKIYVSGNELEVRRFTEAAKIGAGEETYAVIEAEVTEIFYFDNKGFIKNYKYNMASDECNCYIEKSKQPVPQTDVKLGKLVLSTSTAAKEIAE